MIIYIHFAVSGISNDVFFGEEKKIAVVLTLFITKKPIFSFLRLHFIADLVNSFIFVSCVCYRLFFLSNNLIFP